jgi:hypothetical protein
MHHHHKLLKKKGILCNQEILKENTDSEAEVAATAGVLQLPL